MSGLLPFEIAIVARSKIAKALLNKLILWFPKKCPNPRNIICRPHEQSGQVERVRKIERKKNFFARFEFRVAGASHPFGAAYQNRCRRHPLIKEQVSDFWFLGRHTAGLVHRCGEVVTIAKDAERRVGFFPLALVVEQTILIGSKQMANNGWVGPRQTVVDQLRQDMLGIVGLRRNHNKERFLAGAERGVEHVVKLALFRLRQLVVDYEARHVPVFGAGFRRDRTVD